MRAQCKDSPLGCGTSVDHLAAELDLFGAFGGGGNLQVSLGRYGSKAQCKESLSNMSSHLCTCPMEECHPVLDAPLTTLVEWSFCMNDGCFTAKLEGMALICACQWWM